jgi:uncharacterized membrane protein HdeD (DUF308 family)
MTFLNNWKILIFNGIISLIFGLILLFGSGNVFNMLVLIMGFLIAASSVYILINELAQKRKNDVYVIIMASLFTLLSLIMIIKPKLIVDSIFIVIGIVFLTLGLINTVNSLKLKSYVKRKKPMLYSGLSYILLAILLLFFNNFIEVFLTVLLALLLILIGFIMIYFGNELRKDEAA